jgi:hypothetical protein
MIQRSFAPAAALIFVLACAPSQSAPPRAETSAAESAGESTEWKQEFGEDERDFASSGRNPYFVLEPGYTLEFEGHEKGEKTTLVIRVLDDTKTIGGVTARVVEERESRGSELVEVSRNYFAVSRKTSSVYYFGEDVDIYESGRVASHSGSWLHGSNGARYGLYMPGAPRVGDRYYEEIAPGRAMDRTAIATLTESVTTPAGKFESCLATDETTPLEPATVEHKYYAPGIGLIRDGDLRLIRYGNR